ncbi:hypothetical protein [Allomuricauda sp. F6463D]|uniref:hypothetical protein n=1 Tax=Allomuricauda sp. F6463D TaxID=2926409 RepID=UPI001FF1C098|nr:hypothetical protein [Muricauda sp. F6463D]MCK0160967.1 hypothetical protein [Muricauda sp. F6463D]
MKNCIIIFALFMLLKPMVPIMEYIVFYDYIKNELCENKDKIELKCNGKCYLAKQLAKASEKEKNNKDKKTLTIETTIVFFQEIIKSLELSIDHLNRNSKITEYYNALYDLLSVANLLRPPIRVI